MRPSFSILRVIWFTFPALVVVPSEILVDVEYYQNRITILIRAESDNVLQLDK